jgi:hypothetical protein
VPEAVRGGATVESVPATLLHSEVPCWHTDCDRCRIRLSAAIATQL